MQENCIKRSLIRLQVTSDMSQPMISHHQGNHSHTTQGSLLALYLYHMCIKNVTFQKF